MTIMDEVDIVGDEGCVQKERPRIKLPENGIILDFASRVSKEDMGFSIESVDERKIQRVEKQMPSGIGSAFTSFLGELYGTTDVYTTSGSTRPEKNDTTLLRCTEDEADDVWLVFIYSSSGWRLFQHCRQILQLG
jgi:hypothetical protein